MAECIIESRGRHEEAAFIDHRLCYCCMRRPVCCGTSCMHAHGMRNNNQIFHGDQIIKLHVKKIFTRSTTVAVAVANLLGFTARRYASARHWMSAGVCHSACPTHSCIVSRWLKISTNFFLGQLVTIFHFFYLRDALHCAVSK